MGKNIKSYTTSTGEMNLLSLPFNGNFGGQSPSWIQLPSSPIYGNGRPKLVQGVAMRNQQNCRYTQ